jgi:hypothetical protein
MLRILFQLAFRTQRELVHLVHRIIRAIFELLIR